MASTRSDGSDVPTPGQQGHASVVLSSAGQTAISPATWPRCGGWTHGLGVVVRSATGDGTKKLDGAPSTTIQRSSARRFRLGCADGDNFRKWWT
jgi:hypothetical protein